MEYIYRRVPPECPPSFIRPPPPIFPHRKNWYRECAPPSFIRPPTLFRASSFLLSRIRPRPPSRYFASDTPTMHNEVPKCAWHLSETWPTIYSLSLHARCSRHDHRSRPVGVAVVVRQLRGSKHFYKHDVPSQLQRYLSTAAALHGRRICVRTPYIEAPT